MTLDALLAELAHRDITLWTDGERLLFDAPTGALTLDLRAGLAAHRAELIRRLPATAPVAAPAAPLRARPRHDFSRWVYRRAADGAAGWEAPDLPEESRWWARQRMHSTGPPPP